LCRSVHFFFPWFLPPQICRSPFFRFSLSKAFPFPVLFFLTGSVLESPTCGCPSFPTFLFICVKAFSVPPLCLFRPTPSPSSQANNRIFFSPTQDNVLSPPSPLSLGPKVVGPTRTRLSAFKPGASLPFYTRFFAWRDCPTRPVPSFFYEAVFVFFAYLSPFVVCRIFFF